MKFTLSQNISLMRFFGSVKQPYANRFVINFYFRQPFAVFFSDTQKTAFIAWSWFARILRVLHIGNFAQIDPTVVRSVAVYVIYLFCGPISCLVEPRQSVRKIQNIVQTYNNVSVLGDAPGLVSNASPSARFSPSKDAFVRAIMHKFFKAFWRHDVNINAVLCGGQV